MLLALLGVEEKIVLVIVGGFDGELADGVIDSRAEGAQGLIDAGAAPQVHSPFGFQPQVAGQHSTVTGNETIVLFLPVNADVVSPRFGEADAKAGLVVRPERGRLKKPGGAVLGLV